MYIRSTSSFAFSITLTLIGALLFSLSACDGSSNDSVTPVREPRVLILSREGQIASLEVTSPWTIKAISDLGETISSAHCLGGSCVIVHPDPVNALSVVDAQTLEVTRRFDLSRGSDPRDVAFTDDHSIVVSFYGLDYLMQIDLQNYESRQIDLSQFADKDGLPETMMLSACGQQVYAQLQRVDHELGVPSELNPVLVMIDTADDEMLEFELKDTPALDMVVDCSTRQLIVAEPKPIVLGGGSVEIIDLNTGEIRNFLSDGEFANGGVQPISQGVYWVNQHTSTGPGPSSHLTLVGAGSGETYNVFANELVDNMAYDAASNQFFYPNPCATIQDDCDNGLHVFDAQTGVSAGDSIDPGFSPIEVVLSR